MTYKGKGINYTVMANNVTNTIQHLYDCIKKKQKKTKDGKQSRGFEGQGILETESDRVGETDGGKGQGR